MSSYFLRFSSDIKGITLPNKFTFPFYYEPHPLCIRATNEVQSYLENQTDFIHNFGLDKSNLHNAIGKMFGVLIVKNTCNEIGYIAAVSGKMAGTNTHKKFVPPVFDMLSKDSYFLKEEKVVNQLNKTIENLEKDSEYLDLQKVYVEKELESKKDIERKKVASKKAKSIRKEKRKKAISIMDNEAYKALELELSQESLKEKSLINNVKRFWSHTLTEIESQLKEFEAPILELKAERKMKSAALQNYLFEQYKFLNLKKEVKSLIDIFPEDSNQKMPAGSGECAAPKLLQYAFLNELEPIAMAEFWWGISPNKEIRKHQYFYPSCQGKCKPILKHMLSGMELDSNPMLQNPAIGKELEYIYEDEDLLIIYKPEAFLSVPGFHIQDSVYTRVKNKIKNISGPIIVHRLDMDTSGLMVIAKHKKAHKRLQAQFINKTVKKRYTALLDGIGFAKNGIIELPLRVDLEDRPRQLVCDEHGKKAITKWEILEIKDGKTKVHFYPITGRTHQLRVHAAHKLGLKTPIVGDDLYGTKSTRLHLHADSIEFLHPRNKKEMKFYKKASF